MALIFDHLKKLMIYARPGWNDHRAGEQAAIYSEHLADQDEAAIAQAVKHLIENVEPGKLPSIAAVRMAANGFGGSPGAPDDPIHTPWRSPVDLVRNMRNLRALARVNRYWCAESLRFLPLESHPKTRRMVGERYGFQDPRAREQDRPTEQEITTAMVAFEATVVEPTQLENLPLQDPGSPTRPEDPGLVPIADTLGQIGLGLESPESDDLQDPGPGDPGGWDLDAQDDLGTLAQNESPREPQE